MEQTRSTYAAMRENVSAGLDMQRWLELLAVLVVTVSVIGLVAARLGMFNAAPIWVSGILLAYGYHCWTACSPRLSLCLVPTWHVIAVVGIGLLFRLSPYAWILGGQDQGVYVNMAMELAHTGGLEPVDDILAQITDPTIRELYRSGNYGYTYLPGIYSTPEGLVFQFYHLFPVWLAMFGDGLGATAAVYGLTFLSLLSLLLFQRVAHLITGSAIAGLIAGLLLAVNPLHAFFSKFPVTEVPTLALSLISFAFLLTYWRAPAGERQNRFLVLSAMAMGLLFLTRISGFMYLPFLYVFSLAVVLHVEERSQRNALLWWCMVVVGFYMLSIIYGLRWSAPYAHDIYKLSFQPLLGDRWGAALSVLAVILCIGWAAAWLVSRNIRFASHAKRLMALGSRLLPAVVFGCLAMALYQAYRFGFTDAYASDPLYGQRWDLAHKGVRSVLSTSLIASVGYLSPLIFFSFFVSVFYVGRNALLKMLLFFVVCFMGHVSMLQWILPYQPYYARYLVSEFVPYLILFVVCVWAMQPAGRLRQHLGIALMLGGVWTLLLTSLQLGKQELGGVVESVDQLVEGFDQGDVVLVERNLGGNLGIQLSTTLVYTYGLNPIRVSNENLANEEYLNELSRQYDDVYLLMVGGTANASNFQKIDSSRFIQDQYVQGFLPPISIHRGRDLRIDIYRYTPEIPFGYSADSSRGIELVNGWNQQEHWGVWTAGESARIRLDFGEAEARDEIRPKTLEVSGRIYVTPQAKTQHVRVLVNGEVATEQTVKYPHRRFSFSVPLSEIAQDREAIIEVQTKDSISPASLGHSSDTRTIAFGLESIHVLESNQEPW